MTIKVYTSGICGSHEVRKQQQRVIFILQSLPIDLQIIDVTDPGREEDLTFMQEEAKKHNKKTQLPPQIFNENNYCGDYADFELANDDDEIMRFLKLEDGPSKIESLKNAESSGDAITQNGINDHGTNEETTALSEEPISNGINDIDSTTKEQEPDLTNTETGEVENANAEATEAASEEIKKEAEAASKKEEETKESSEEESEEESD